MTNNDEMWNGPIYLITRGEESMDGDGSYDGYQIQQLRRRRFIRIGNRGLFRRFYCRLPKQGRHTHLHTCTRAHSYTEHIEACKHADGRMDVQIIRCLLTVRFNKNGTVSVRPKRFLVPPILLSLKFWVIQSLSGVYVYCLWRYDGLPSLFLYNLA